MRPFFLTISYFCTDVGDSGQERSFYVKFVGEGVSDHGGPYRACFQKACSEEPKLLGLFSKSIAENKKSSLCELSYTKNTDTSFENNNSSLQYETAQLSKLRFLGNLIGTAVRHRIQIPIQLAMNVWSPLVGQSLQTSSALFQIDPNYERSLQKLEQLELETNHTVTKETIEATMDQYEDAMLAARGIGNSLTANDILLLNDLKNYFLTTASKESKDSKDFQKRKHIYFIENVRKIRLQRSAVQFDSLLNGLGDVLPIELLPLFTPHELELLVCGPNEINIDLLKSCTEYKGVKEEDEHIQYFWNTLEHHMTKIELSNFIKFVSASSRLPSSASDFLMPFKIEKPDSNMKNMKTNPDSYLPKVYTCFFQMYLPKYTNQKSCNEKIKQAVRECTTMDADVIERNGLESYGDE